MQFTLPNEVQSAINLLVNNGYQAYVVGGCIRNFILKYPIDDYDITTSATPKQMQSVFSEYKIFDTGIKHGTLTIMINGLPLEITTYRIEGEYIDNRRPTSVSFSSKLEEDLKRRDFTMNALAYNPNLGLVDLFNGRNDIYAHKIRCIGNPKERFDEDALRILRALRFSATLGFAIDDSTLSAMRLCKENLKSISAERISSELFKIICGTNMASVLRKHADILSVVIPEIKQMINFNQNTPYHIYDVFEHTIASMEAIQPDPLLRLCMLFHDIGKPSTYTEDDEGVGHFPKHSESGIIIATNLIKRLKFPSKFSEDLLLLIKYHDFKFSASKKDVRIVLRDIGLENLQRLLLVKRADNEGKNPVYNLKEEYDLIESTLVDIIKNDDCFCLKQLALNGDDLIKIGMNGKDIGNALEHLLDEVINEKLKNNYDDLLAYCLINLLEK